MGKRAQTPPAEKAPSRPRAKAKVMGVEKYVESYPTPSSPSHLLLSQQDFVASQAAGADAPEEPQAAGADAPEEPQAALADAPKESEAASLIGVPVFPSYADPQASLPPLARAALAMASKPSVQAARQLTRKMSSASAIARSKAMASVHTVGTVEGSEPEPLPDAPSLMVSPSGKISIVADSAGRMFKKLTEEARAGFVDAGEELPDELLVGSGCSGSEVFYDVMQALAFLWSDLSLKPNNFKSLFACEKVPFKQKYIMNLEHVRSNEDCCVFSDLMELCEVEANCVRHDRKCRVPTKLDVWACGFSCCPYSRLNPKSSQNNNSSSAALLAAKSNVGKVDDKDGVETSVGNFNYVKRTRPLFSFMENVEDYDDDMPAALILEQQNSNLSALRFEFEDEGFLFVSMVVNAVDYFLPQGRTRLMMVAIPVDHELLAEPPRQSLQEDWQTLVLQLQLEMLPLSALLLKDDDPAVIRELEHMEAKHEASTSRDKTKDTKWQTEHEDFYRSCGLRWGGLTPSKKLASSRWWLALPPREKDICVLYEHLHSDIQRLDVSQTISRCRASNKPYSFTVTPGMKAYDFQRHRLIIGREGLKLQGIDWEEVCDLDMFAEHELQDLAGNAFASPCVLAVAMSFFSLLRFTRQKEVDVGQLAVALNS